MTKSAVLHAVNHPLEVMDLDLEAPRAGEVRVELAATGVCHSDLSATTGVIGTSFPIVLGHEGAGVVAEVGEGVTGLSVGDRVVLAWITQCGTCYWCQRGQAVLCEVGLAGMGSSGLPDRTTRFSHGGKPVYQMSGLGTFSTECVVNAAACLPIPDDMPFASAALIGCGVLTGWGAAANTADIRVGDAVAVVGCGGVGLNAVQGARLAGAGVLIAIDPSEQRLDRARQLGATHCLQPGDGAEGLEDLVAKVKALTGGRGVDTALEVVGRQTTVDAAWAVTRRGGEVVLVGAGPHDVVVHVPAFMGVVFNEKTIKGSLYGSSNVRRDVPRLNGLYAAGKLELDGLVTERCTLDQVNEALRYCAEGRGVRAVIEL